MQLSPGLPHNTHVMRFTKVSRGEWRTMFAAGALALVVFGALACGESGPVEPSMEIPDGANLIDQDNLKFAPTSLAVAAGEQVYFLNSETAPHTVTIDGDDISGRMNRGDVVVYTFETSGEYAITCDYHPQMQATITVE